MQIFLPFNFPHTWYMNRPCYLSFNPHSRNSAKTTNYEASHYVILSNLISFSLSSVQIFSSPLCSQKHSIYYTAGNTVLFYNLIFTYLVIRRNTKILSRVWVTLDGDLLTSLTHDSYFHLIIAPSLISTFYKSLQHTRSLFQSSTRRFLVTASNNGYSSASVIKSSLNGSSFPAAY
jgi:hypothetical protein